MGEVRRPESLIRRRPRPETPDMPHIPAPSRPAPTGLEELFREVQMLKTEIFKLKQAMREHGITVE
jgi:hypothetical protein